MATGCVGAPTDMGRNHEIPRGPSILNSLTVYPQHPQRLVALGTEDLEV